MNKILLTILLTFTLSACTLFPQRFDNHEHAMLASFVVDVEYLQEACKTDADNVRFWLRHVEQDIRKLEVYSRFIPKNKEVHNVVTILKGDIDEFKKRYDTRGHNKVYCETKAGLIHKKATRMLEATGKKPR